MAYSEQKAQEIFELKNAIGEIRAAKILGISIGTVLRACRIHKQGKDRPRAPKILLLDIETLPMQVRVWGLYKQRISHKNIINDWVMVSWAAKWLCSPDMMSDILTPKECLARDDKRICQSVYKLIDEADIVVAHNLRRFDIRKLRSRFLMHGFQPYSPVKLVDTLLESRRNFGHSAHALDYLGELMSNKGKLDTNYQLWIDCESGEKEALDKMLTYNKADVELLEEVYIWIRGWMTSHPNVSLYIDSDRPVCNNCGGDVEYTGKYKYTKVNRYDAYKCKSCGFYCRSRLSDVSTEEKATVLA